MERLNAKVMLVFGAMLLFVLQTSSFSQIDTSRTDRTRPSATPDKDKTITPTIPGTTNKTTGIIGDTSGRASTYYSQAEIITNDLKTRLNLNPDQMGEVKDILIDYQSDLAEQGMKGTYNDRNSQVGGIGNKADLQQTTNERIESVLNDSQKQQFSDIQTEWWNKVNTQLNSDKLNSHKSKSETDKDKDENQKTDTDTEIK